MILVHHLNNSRSQRVLWLLEELELPYEIRRYTRDPLTQLAPPELLQVHPLGKSPVLTDEGITVAESGAIIEYLLDRYGNGRLRPAPGTPERLRFTYWLHFAEGSAMPMLLLKLIFDRIEEAPVPLLVRWLVRPVARGIAGHVKKQFILPNLERQRAFLEQTLLEQAWFAGAEFSAADIQMSFAVEAYASRGGLQDQPRLRDFLERIHARPAYGRALERGGPYRLPGS